MVVLIRLRHSELIYHLSYGDFNQCEYASSDYESDVIVTWAIGASTASSRRRRLLTEKAVIVAVILILMAALKYSLVVRRNRLLRERVAQNQEVEALALMPMDLSTNSLVSSGQQSLAEKNTDASLFGIPAYGRFDVKHPLQYPLPTYSRVF